MSSSQVSRISTDVSNSQFLDSWSLVNFEILIRSMAESLPPAIAAVAVATRIGPLLCI